MILVAVVIAFLASTVTPRQEPSVGSLVLGASQQSVESKMGIGIVSRVCDQHRDDPEQFCRTSEFYRKHGESVNVLFTDNHGVSLITIKCYDFKAGTSSDYCNWRWAGGAVTAMPRVVAGWKTYYYFSSKAIYSDGYWIVDVEKFSGNIIKLTMGGEE